MPTAEPLVLALLAGDEQAFGELVSSLTPTLRAMAARHVSTDAAVEDVVQDTWLVVLRSLPAFEGRASLRTWVVAIALNVARERGRSDRRTVPFCDLPDGALDEATAQVTATVRAELAEDAAAGAGPSEPASAFVPAWRRGRGTWRRPPQTWPPHPEQAVLDGELRDVVDAAVAELPVRQRAVVLLCDEYGLSGEEVGRLLGISAGNVRVLLHRGRTSLRRSLAEHHHPGGGRP